MALPLPVYDRLDALGLADLVARREVTPAELLAAARARIDAVNPSLNAVVARLDARAERAADAASDIAAAGGGPFAGVPYLLKDLGTTLAGVPTSNGMAAPAGQPAPVTSTDAERLERAGLVVLGKTNTPELGLTFTTEPAAFGSARNPWDPARTPGGSSGGAAAAVASGMVPAAHASDGGGSIRVPAACCGLFGLKPSRGRVPMGPQIGEAWGSLAATHALTRSVRDSAALLDIVSGPAPGDPYAAPAQPRPYRDEVGAPPGRLRIALQTVPDNGAAVDPACRAAAEDAATLCADLGHRVEEAAPAIDDAAFGDAFLTTVSAHLAADLAAMEQALGAPLDEAAVAPLTAALRRQGETLAARDYARARTDLQIQGRYLGAFLARYDVLLTPATAKPPVPLGELAMADPDVPGLLARIAAFAPFTQLANAAGCPSMSVPLTWSETGLPLGSLFTAALGREDLLFRLAAQLEAARPWFHRRPPVHAAG